MAIHDWSETAANNDDADATINWLEGQAPSTVNGSARSMMAIVKKGLGHVVSVRDYGAVGDGTTDDTNAIQSAITAAGNNGIVLGAKGDTYLISSSGVSISSLTSLKMLGNGAKIKIGSVATQAPAGLGSTAIFLDSCTNVVFSGWDIDGNAIASNIIGVKGCTDCEVSFNRINSGGLSGVIFALNNTRSRYLFNRVSTTTGAARGMWLGNFNTSQMETDMQVIGNTVTGCPATGIVCASVGGRISNNHVSALTAGSGIIFGGGNGFSSKYLTITGNTCRGIGTNGHGIQSDVIYSTSADVPIGIVISNNICELNEGDGIFCTYLNGGAITGNVCINNNAGGSGSGHGIDIDEAEEVTVSGNYCCDTRSGGSRTQSNGINVIANIGTGNIKNLSISGNICHNNATSGMQIQSNSTHTVTGVTVSGNICNSNASRGIQISEATVGNVSRLTVVGNICQGNTTDDLRVDVLDAAVNDNQYTNDVAATTRYWQFTDLDTTPSVKGQRRTFRCSNSGATTITNFDDGVPGQYIKVYFTNANSTINHGGNFVLKGSANVTPVANGFMEFFRPTTVWIESGRSF